MQERRIELPIPNGRGILSPDRMPSSDTPAYGASKENRTPITSLEGWGNNRYTIPALVRPHRVELCVPVYKTGPQYRRGQGACLSSF